MKKRKRKTNYRARYGVDSLVVAKDGARERVLRVAKRRGFVTSAQAKIIGGWRQPAYQLKAMERAKLLKQVWMPA